MWYFFKSSGFKAHDEGIEKLLSLKTLTFLLCSHGFAVVILFLVLELCSVNKAALGNGTDVLHCCIYICVFLVEGVLGCVCLCHILIAHNCAVQPFCDSVIFTWNSMRVRRKYLVSVKGILLDICNCNDLKCFHRFVGESYFYSLFASFVLF